MKTIEELVKENKTELLNLVECQKPLITDSDEWVTFDSTLELQFAVNDDEQSENFNKTEVYAYPVRDGRIDTGECELVTVY